MWGTEPFEKNGFFKMILGNRLEKKPKDPAGIHGPVSCARIEDVRHLRYGAGTGFFPCRGQRGMQGL